MGPKKVLHQLNIITTPVTQVDVNVNISTIEKETKSRIKNIIHISDIHIRHGTMEYSRYDEYRHVFTNFVAEIACLDCVINRYALFVITGNIFHGKGKLDTPAIKLYFELMDRLLSFGSVIMICGNHEYRKDDLAHPDMLETMIIPYNKLHNQSSSQNKLIYLKDTGYYVFDHIGFGVKSITSNDVFPKPDLSVVDIKIALYQGNIDTHNTVHFEEYDYVLLGNNSYQFVDSQSYNYIYGYPGTFIQQEYTDSYLHHGFLEWNISSKKMLPKAINIDNDYSMIVLKNISNEIKLIYNINGKKNIVNFNALVCPKQARIKAIGFNNNESQKLTMLFETHNIKPSYITYANNLLNDDTNSVDLSLSEINDPNDLYNNITKTPITMYQLNCPTKWLEYINGVCESNNMSDKYEFISQIMNNPEILLIPDNANITDDIKERINNRNKKIRDALNDYNTYIATTSSAIQQNSTSVAVDIYFKVLKWSYIMCYGELNYFDFECMSGKFALLNGRNAMGKSAFLDVLCIALYGEPSKHRNIMYGKQNNGKIINNACPVNKNMCVSLSFKFNNINYEISREYTYTKVESKQGLKCINASIKNVDTIINDDSNIANNITDVNEWIINTFGTLDNLLMSSFITQIETNNFFNLKQEEQKQVLDNALHLESISSYSKIIKEASLGYNDIINTVKANIDIISNLKCSSNKPQKNINNDIEFVNDMINSKTLNIQKLRETYNTFLGKIGNVADFKELSELLKTTETTSSKRLTKLKRKLESNEFNSITEADKLYCNTLILNGSDTHAIKYNELTLQITELQNDISKLDINLDTLSCDSINIESVINTLINLEKTKPVLQMSDALFNKKQKHIDSWNNDQQNDKIRVEWLENPDYLYILRDEKTHELTEVKTQYDYLVKHSITKPQFENIPIKPIINIDCIDCIDVDNSDNIDNIDNNLLNTLSDLIKTKQLILNDLYKNKIVVVKTEKDYTRWLKTYNEWLVKFSNFINEDSDGNNSDDSDDGDNGDDCDNEDNAVDELDTELQQTLTYRDSIIKKVHEKELLEKELSHLDNELRNFTNIPYNESCWACQKQPMRIRHNQINTSKSELLHSISKIKKYLEKISASNSKPLSTLITDLNTKIEELHMQIALRKEYEYSVTIKTSEYESWQEIKESWKQEKTWNNTVSKLENDLTLIKLWHDYVQYILWKEWKKEIKSLNTNLTDLTNDIKNIDDFFASYTLISEMSSELDKENELRNKFDVWNKLFILNTNYKTYFEITSKIDELQYEIKNLDGSQKINTELVDKVKEYIKIEDECKLLERFILYETSQKTRDNINADEAQLNILREKLILLQKEISDTEKYNDKIQKYTEYYDILIHTRSYINILEDLFIGSNSKDTNSENTGYKEWVYKTHVLPLIQSHINSFLGLIDNINLEIIYTNKTFQYVVHDRNNTPNLSMTSGYQRFIIGLALRIAFAKIGAVGQNIKHLFIDEGFVACDIYNLDKVNMILKAIHTYGGYDSIMLMSHLDSIRSAADICIDIKRIRDDYCGEYSQINFKDDITNDIIESSITPLIIEKINEPVKKTRKRITKV